MKHLRTKRPTLLSFAVATAIAAPLQAQEVQITAVGNVTSVTGPGLTDPGLSQLAAGDSITFVYTVCRTGTPITDGFTYSLDDQASEIQSAMSTVGAIPAPGVNQVDFVDEPGNGDDSITALMELPGQAAARLSVTSSAGGFLVNPNITSYIGTGFVPFGSLTLSGDISDGITTVQASFSIVGFDDFVDPIGANYCMANPNSTGVSASIAAVGSRCVADNDVTLIASNLPAGNFGFFINSRTQGFLPNPAGSEGNLCILGEIGRFNQPGQVMQADASGSIVLPIDLMQIPTPTGFTAAMAGDTWNFQAWYRDTSPAGLTSNFTDGVEVVFN